MSFLDHLAKNLNTQTEFFTQLSNISRDSRAKTVSRPELELKQKTSLNVEKRSPTESNRANEKEDFKVEKEDFFTTAKKVFQEYKIKADRKTQDKKEPKLQEELETADQVLDLIFGLVDPQIQAQIELQANLPRPDLRAALQALEVKPSAQELDPELLDFFLGRINIKVNTQIETLTKEIVNLDLNTDEGITEILKISNNIETLQNVEKAIEQIKTNLKDLIDIETSSIRGKEIKPEIELLIESKIEAQITLEEPESESIRKVLDTMKASLKQERAIRDISLNKPETNNFNVKIVKDTEIKIETNKTLDYTKAEVEILEVTEGSSPEAEQGQDFSSDNFETLFPREIKVSNIKIKSLSQPIALKNIPEVIAKEVLEVKASAKQEIKMMLDPENLGRMQLSITREDNQIHISMIVRTDEAQTKLEQKINDIKLVLKEKGFEANIEVNKSDTSNSNQSQQNQGHARQGNEAKEEQKEKYLNQVPQWISSDIEELDFTEALNRAL